MWGALVSLSRATVFAAFATPAQLTRMRSWPCASRALANAAATLSSAVTSTSQKVPPISTCDPCAAVGVAVEYGDPGPRDGRARAPSLRRRPEAAPVTTAVIRRHSCLSLSSSLAPLAYARRAYEDKTGEDVA